MQTKRSRPAGEPGGGGNGKGFGSVFIPRPACGLQEESCHACPYCRPVRTPRLMKIVCSFTGLVLWKKQARQ